MVAFSPPYWGLRSYLDEADPAKSHELGDEPLHDCLAWAKGERPCGGCFACNLRQVAAEVWRVLRADGTFWLNLGDSYASNGTRGEASNSSGLNGGRGVGDSEKIKQRGVLGRAPTADGLKPKDLVGIPWRVALALQADGWYLRNDVIWSKTNPMPESMTDRFTRAHEYVFLFSKQERYFFDQDAVREPHTSDSNFRNKSGEKQAQCLDIGAGFREWNHPIGRNRRTVWELPTEPYSGAHFATWPTALVEIMVRAGTSEKGACPSCGAQWLRVVEKSEPEPAPNNPNPVNPYPAASHTQGQYSTTLHMIRVVSSVSWQPGCGCGCEPIPAVVLDLFAGSGTTLVMARQLGRSAVGVDLNFDYLTNQARCRLDLDRLEALEQGEGYIRPLKPSRPRKVLAGQMSLL